ncbi:hypothetical protein BaRGS_00003196, partial [Batillaria attramentaria]
KHNHDGPTQYVQLASARAYVASAYVKLLNDAPDHSPQELHVQIEYIYSDDSHHYQSAADHTATASDGWVYLHSQFDTPKNALKSARVYLQGPVPSVSFVADDVTIREAPNQNAAGEVLMNGGFESRMSHWQCWDCTCTPATDDPHTGSTAIKVTNRKHSHDGITQYVDLSPGQRYVASAYVKLLNDAADHTTQRIQIEMEYVYEDGTHHYQSAADLRATASDGWVNVTGTLHVPNVGPDPSVSYAIDDASLALIPEREPLQNGGFESGMSHWLCWDCECIPTTDDSHSGQHALRIIHRQHGFDGPSQYIDFLPGQSYVTSAYFKLLNPPPDNSTQRVHVMIDYKYTDGSHHYVAAAEHPIRMSDGWVHVTGTLAVPNAQIENARVYLQGPVPSVNMLVDDVSVTLVPATETWQRQTDNVINQKRKSDIHFKVTLPAGMSKGDVQIHVLQTKNSFPFGTAVNAGKYNSNAASGRYRDFIHKHFSWAVPESSLKWVPTEPQKGHTNYQPPLDMIHGLRAHGIKVRGHNLVWPSEGNIPAWARALSGDELREAVKHHIEETMNVTRGLSIGTSLKYLAQTRKFLAANVGLYGIGAQCHFNDNHEPSPYSMK